MKVQRTLRRASNFPIVSNMSSLAHRLKKVQVVANEPLPDFSKMSLLELEECKIDFGTKHAGDSYLSVWNQDQPWVMWLIQHYGNSKKPSHMKFLKFVEMKIERAELEGTAVPVTEPSLSTPAGSLTPMATGKPSMSKAKAKSQPKMPPMTTAQLLEEIDDFEEDTFEMLNPLETEKDAEIQCLQNRMLNIENALQQVICHLGAQQPTQEQ